MIKNHFVAPALLVAFALSLFSFSVQAEGMFPEVPELPAHPEIPDPLMPMDGSRVTNRAQWFNQRRPELMALFQNYMYGTLPPAPEHLHFEVERVDAHFFNGKATKKEVTIRLFEDTNAPEIHLLVVIPNERTNKGSSSLEKAARGFPVFVGLNFCGNHTLVTNGEVALPTSWMAKSCPECVDHHATEAGRGAEVDTWNLEQSIDRGYAVATFYYGDLEPDMTNATTGLHAWLLQHASSALGRMAPLECGDIAVWAWGLSRAADYLVTDSALDPKRMAVVGHSRLGKAAIFAAAFDERFAVAMPLQAGCCGTSPSRGTIGETVKSVNQHFPHWFNAEFKQFSAEPDRLPFDQNCLIALVAPRPVLIGTATEDTWGNPAGAFEMLKAAEPVYQLLGVPGIDAAQKMPGTNQLVGDHLAYFIRPGKHSMAKIDWQFFYDYADKTMP